MAKVKEDPPRSLPELVTKALKAFEECLANGTLKPTLAEYLKLLQVEKECGQEVEVPREITVTWIEPEGNFLEE